MEVGDGFVPPWHDCLWQVGAATFEEKKSINANRKE